MNRELPIKTLTRFPASLALGITICIILAGCANNFSQTYSGMTVNEVQQKRGWSLDTMAAEPVVIGVPKDDFQPTLRRHMEDGWVDLGYSGWSGQGQAGSADDAKVQARKVGANLVLLSSEFLGTSSYRNTYYTVNAAFLVKRIGKPACGIIARQLTPEEQKSSGTVQGLAVDVVVRDSPAADAGVVTDDVIKQIGEYQILSYETFHLALTKLQGTRTTLSLIRQGKPIELSIVLGANRITTAP